MNIPRLTIKADDAYLLEKYRLYIYSPILLLTVFHIIVSIYYIDFLQDLILYNLLVFLLIAFTGLVFYTFWHHANSILFYAKMSMEEWRHKTYEIYILKNLFKNLRNYPYVPFLFAVASGVLYYWLVQSQLVTGIENSGADNKFSLVWQIQASILGLVFVTLSFLIGLLNANEMNKKIGVGKRLANKLHFKSLVIINTLLTICVGASAIYNDLPLWVYSTSVFSFIFLIFSIIYLFQNFIRYLFQLDLLEDLILKELKFNLRDSLSEEIKQKVGQQLFQNYAKKLNIYVDYATADTNSEAICSKTKGVVKDIAINRLKKIAQTISGSIPVHDFKKNTTENYKAVLTKGLVFNSTISDRYDEIALVPKGESIKLNGLMQSVFSVNEFVVKNEFTENLKQLVDMIIGYLKISPNYSLEILEFMGVLIDESSKVMSEYQIKFDYETSKQLTHFDWKSIGQIVYSLDDVYKEVYTSGNLEMSKKILSFTDDRIDTSFKYRNHYLFKEFFSSYVRQYYLAQQSNRLSDEEKNVVTQNIYQKIEYLVKYKIELDQDSLPEREVRDFYIGVVTDIQKVAREMVKGALEYNDIDGVETFSRMLIEVSSTLDKYDDIRYVENMVKSIHMDVDSNGETEEELCKIEYLEKIVKLNNKLDKNKQLSMFALGAWTLELYKRGEVDQKKLVRLIRPFIQHFPNLESVTQTYFEIKKYKRSEDLNLSSWEIFKKEKGQVHTVRLDWLTYFYVLLALRRLPDDLSSDQFIYAEGLTEYPSSSLNAEKDDIVHILEDLQEKTKFWSPLLPKKTKMVDQIEKKDQLILLHENGVKQREKEETDFLIKASIDPEVLKTFKTDFFREYKKAHSVKKIIQKFGVYEDHTREPNNTDEGLGIKQLDFKYPYIKNWYVSTAGYAENYASAMIRGESQNIMKTIEEAIQSIEPFHSEEKMASRVDTMLKRLTNAGKEANIILIGDWLNLHHLKSSEHFVGEQTNHGNDYHGKYRDIDVFYLPNETTRHKVFVIDLQKLGILKQMQLKGAEGVEVNLNVSEITPETIEKWIEEDADIIKKDNKQMSREEIDTYMGERVLLDIFQKIDFEVKDNTAGLYSAGPK